MAEIQVRTAEPDRQEARALFAAYATEVAALAGPSPASPASAAPEDALRPPDGAFWLAVLDGDPVGCVGARALDGRTVELKRLYVSPAARGHRAGARLVATAEDWARARGATRAVLDTRSELQAACRLYRSRGWVEVAPYNTGSPADLWFAKDLDGSARPVGWRHGP